MVLSGVLAELGWSSARVAQEVNAYMGPHYVGRSSVAEWVANGRVPREPLPTVVAHLLSDSVGRSISVADLWGAGVKESMWWLPADHGHLLTWDYPGVLRTADGWITNVGRTMDIDRRHFMAISGTALTDSAWQYVDTPANAAALGTNAATPGSMKITPGVVDALETTISGLRKLDDLEGGNSHSLRLAHNHFRTVAEYVLSASTSDQKTHLRLLDAWANLCQITGWMAVDAELHGLAQRYYLTGLQITKITGNRELGAHFLGCLSQQAAYRGLGKDATDFAEAAVEAAKGTGPAIQAMAYSRSSEAQAAMGNAYACQVAIDKAHNLLSSSKAASSTPQWLYWFDHAALESRAGWIMLALTQASSRDTNNLLKTAESLLGPHLAPHRTVNATDFPRDTLVHTSWLARSYVWRGELEQAVETGRVCMELLPKVDSARATALLREFTNELTQHRGARGNSEVTELTKTLQTSTYA